MSNDIKITPVGIARHPWIKEPDYAFNDNLGKYKIQLIMPKIKADGIIHEIIKANESQEGYDKTKAEWPFSNEIDDQGVATGDVVIKFKMKAKVIPKDGAPWEQKPIIKNAQGERLVDCNLGGGTECQVAYELYPYIMTRVENKAQTKWYGVSLRLKGIRVLKLVEWEGDGPDFGELPEGYQVSDPKFLDPEETDDIPF